MARRALIVVVLAWAGCTPQLYRPLPPLDAVPASLAAERWKLHWQDDVKPFWMSTDALGSPEGNYPTYRTMTGAPAGQGDRYTRMMGRQVYTYAMGYALTGDPALLQRAAAGVEWLRTRGKDPRGGYFQILDASGTPKTGRPKYAQDLSYVMLGFSAWWFVTRDPLAEAELLAGRDLLFDPATFFDAPNKRIRDGMDEALAMEIDQSNDSGGWELVAQLDPVNAFLLLSQPTLSSPARRAQFRDDLRLLATTMLDRFWSEPERLFWGTTTLQSYGARHVDFGHTAKTWWMLLAIDKRLDDHPFHDRIMVHGPATLARAWDASNGRWAKRPTSPTGVEYGNDWWIAAELDQLSAALALLDRTAVERLATVASTYEQDWVDPRGELIPGIRADGRPVWTWSDSDTAKCNEWKNGFHSTEHALIMSMLGASLAGTPVELHFAVPQAQASTFIAVPYTFDGTERGRVVGQGITAGGRRLVDVTVEFTDLH